MNVTGMNHFTILADDLEKTREFYSNVVGLQEGYRPPLGFPGAWFYLGESAILHVIERKPLPDASGGVFDHMAFSATDLAGTLQKLKSLEIGYDLIHQVGSEVWQVFFFDPNGAKIELDFAPHERPGAD